MAMEDNERDRHEALKRRRMDVENQVGAMKELFRASRDQKLVDVGHKVARHIILEGVIPHVLEVRPQDCDSGAGYRARGSDFRGKGLWPSGKGVTE